jgi:hypothetical protein
MVGTRFDRGETKEGVDRDADGLGDPLARRGRGETGTRIAGGDPLVGALHAADVIGRVPSGGGDLPQG